MSNFPEFPLAVTSQTKPGLPRSGGGSSYTSLAAGVKVGGTKTSKGKGRR
jgi:hypothetical protein